MTVDDYGWLFEHFDVLDGGSDPVLATRYMKRLRHEADRRGVHPAELLAIIEERRMAAGRSVA